MTQQFMHPAALIVQARTNFEFTEKRINTQLLPKDFSIIKEEIEKRISHYNCLTNAAIKCHNLEENTEIQSYQDDGRREILLSAINADFLAKYKEEIHYERKYTDLLKFISDTIGTQSATQKAQDAEERLSSITRYVHDNEKFERFLERIKRIAKNASNQTSIQSYLVETAFRKNLTPRHISFLREHEKTELTIENVAKYLDRMKKNLKDVSVNSLELNDTAEKISNLSKQNTELQASNNELHNKFDSLQQEITRLMMTMSAHSERSAPSLPEVNQITGKSPPTKSRSKTTQPRYRRTWRNHPITCEKCGLWGHRAPSCWGPTCPICKTDGHSKFICPQQSKLSKNL